MEINKVFRPSSNELDIDQRIFKAHSADFCAKKGKEESLKFHSTTKRTVWTWYSASEECVIYTFYEEPKRRLEDLISGKKKYFSYLMKNEI